MGSMFKKPKAQKFEPSAEQQAIERQQLEQQRGQESEMSERRAMQKRRRAGRQSLLTGTEAGVGDSDLKSTLG